MLIMKTTVQIQSESHPPWEDWEDNGGFDDEEALMGKRISFQSAPFLETPWYYEKKRSNRQKPIPVSIQMSFL